MGTVDLVQDTSQLQSLLDDVNAFIYDRSVATVSAAEYIPSTANGGEAIQAAIDALPAGGGVVVVPHEGPDGSSNRWHVNTPINMSGATAIIGVGQPVLIAQSNITSIITSAGWLKDLHITGGTATVTNGVDGVSSTRLDHVEIQNCENGIHIDDSSAAAIDIFWSYIHDNNSGCFIRSIAGKLRVEYCTFSDNQFGMNIQGAFINGYVDSISMNSSDACVQFSAAADYMKIAGSVLTSTGGSGVVTVASGVTLKDLRITETSLTGDSSTTHGIDNQGTLVDSTFHDLFFENITGAPYNNVVNDPTNTTRVTVDGLGYNGANDPASGGDWNGNGKEGARVLWDNGGTPTLAEYVNGTWYSRAL